MAEERHYPSLDSLRCAAAEIGRRIECQMIVLFGSTARQDDPEPEDLDLGILGREPLDYIAVTNEFIRSLRTQHVDIVDLRRADPLLLMLVARDGIPLGTIGRNLEICGRSKDWRSRSTARTVSGRRAPSACCRSSWKRRWT